MVKRRLIDIKQALYYNIHNNQSFMEEKQMQGKIRSYIISSLLVLFLTVTGAGCGSDRPDYSSKPAERPAPVQGSKYQHAPTARDLTAKTAPPAAAPLEKLYQSSFRAFHNRKYSEAIQLADKIIKADSNFYKAYNIKGIALAYSHQYNAGMANIDRALNLKPDYGYARFNKALAYELYRDYDQALLWYDKALEAEKYVWSYYGKASINGRRGDVTNTVKFLQAAISMDSSVREVARHEADFKPVRNSPEFKQLVNNQ